MVRGIKNAIKKQDYPQNKKLEKHNIWYILVFIGTIYANFKGCSVSLRIHPRDSQGSMSKRLCLDGNHFKLGGESTAQFCKKGAYHYG